MVSNIYVTFALILQIDEQTFFLWFASKKNGLQRFFGSKYLIKIQDSTNQNSIESGKLIRCGKKAPSTVVLSYSCTKVKICFLI